MISAIDIGSNAMRMIIGEAHSHHIRIIKICRSPIRLGQDVFVSGKIQPSTFKNAAEAFKDFSELNKKHNVTKCRAIATSALREALNKKEFSDYILEKSQIQIEIIDGLEEARLIHKAVSHELDLSSQNCLLIDVGGGSVEITYSEKNKIIISKSFLMGTVRTIELLKKKNLSEKNINIIIGDYYSPMITEFFSKDLSYHKAHLAAGTGGNLEYLGKLKAQILNKTPNTYVTTKELSLIIEKLREVSISERIEKLGFKPDRADVIVPALMVVELIMRQAGLEKILIPYVGLRDGILLDLMT